MRPELQTELDPMQMIAEVQTRLEQLQREHVELRGYVLGPEGDIRKGLVWIVTMQGELLINLEKLVSAQATSIAQHAQDGLVHVRRGEGGGMNTNRLLYDVVKMAGAQLTVIVIVAIFGLLALGAQVRFAHLPGTP